MIRYAHNQHRPKRVGEDRNPCVQYCVVPAAGAAPPSEGGEDRNTSAACVAQIAVALAPADEGW